MWILDARDLHFIRNQRRLHSLNQHTRRRDTTDIHTNDAYSSIKRIYNTHVYLWITGRYQRIGVNRQRYIILNVNILIAKWKFFHFKLGVSQLAQLKHHIKTTYPAHAYNSMHQVLQHIKRLARPRLAKRKIPPRIRVISPIRRCTLSLLLRNLFWPVRRVWASFFFYFNFACFSLTYLFCISMGGLPNFTGK